MSFHLCSASGVLSGMASDPTTVFPERLVIYHAGTGRVLFLAVLKLTTVVLSAIFCGVFVPAYIAEEKPWRECAGRESPPHPNTHAPPQLTIPQWPSAVSSP